MKKIFELRKAVRNCVKVVFVKEKGDFELRKNKVDFNVVNNVVYIDNNDFHNF